MTHHDPLGEFLVKLKNAKRSGKMSFRFIASIKLKEVAKLLLKKSVFISCSSEFVSFSKKNSSLRKEIVTCFFAKSNDELFFEDYRRISRPGKKIFLNAKKLKDKFLRTNGIVVVNTSTLGLTTANSAIKNEIGGEPLFEI